MRPLARTDLLGNARHLPHCMRPVEQRVATRVLEEVGHWDPPFPDSLDVWPSVWSVDCHVVGALDRWRANPTAVPRRAGRGAVDRYSARSRESSACHVAG